MKTMALLLLALGSLAPPVWSADDLMSSQLIDEARQWQQKDRDDIAADLWRKLLLADPMHPEALVKLGAIEARAGNMQQAMNLYKRATQLKKPPAGLNSLSAALSAAKPAASQVIENNPAKQPRVESPPKAKIPLATSQPNKASTEMSSPSADMETETLKLKLAPSLDLSHLPRP